ncbi:MAG: PorV/PorQ family protein [Elusimicrobia bacterium]|nr:PorV/PorQ family protein [Elusimicrobiota bacterium]
MTNYKLQMTNYRYVTGIFRWFLTLSVICHLSFLICLYAAGSTSAEFLLIPKGAKASAMAGTYTSGGNDSTVIYYNPAGIALIKEKDISFSHSQWLESINLENLSYSAPLNKAFSIGVGLEYLGIRGIAGMANQLSPIDDFSSHDLSMVTGISYLLNKNISFGLNTRYIEEKIDDEKATAISFDFGSIYRQRINSHKHLSIGIAVQNIALTKPKFIDQTEDIPAKIVSGISYKPLGEALLLSSDLVLMKGSKPSINTGSELFVYDTLCMRFGYKLDTAFENHSRITCGAGIIFENMSIDYAYLPFESLTDTHTLSIGFKFK